MKSHALWIGIVAAGLLTAGCEQQPSEPRAQAAQSPPTQQPTERLPVTDLAGLRTILQETVAADQVLVVDFWATWCKPCVAMFPELHTGLHAMGDAVRPITVTLDDPGENEQRAIAFLTQHDALKDAYLLSVADGAREAVVDGLGDQWNVLVVPAILVFDQQGTLAGEFLGGDASPVLNRVRELAAR